MRITLPILLLSLAVPLSPALAQETESVTVAESLTGLPAQDSIVDAIYATTDDEMQVEEILTELVEGIGPRLTGSQNLTEAGEWAMAKFKSFGIENVRMEEWGTFPVGFDRRFASGHITWPIKEELVFNTRSWTPGTDGTQRGAAVLAPTNDEELEALKGHLKGAWVIATSGTYSPRFGSGQDELRDRFGAMCDEEGIYGVIRPSGKNGLLRTSGNYRLEYDNLPTRVSILLFRDQFTTIYDFLKDGERVELEFDIDQSFKEGPIPQYNVIAEIPGTDLADELIIFGGHLDSWDGAGGAQDNGTGTSTTLEAARLLMKAMTEQGVQPRRTIRFMLWGGEEQGLLGSRAYIRQHPEENDRISAVLVHDGGTNACSGIRTTPNMMPLFEEAFAPIVAHTADAEDDNLRFRLVSAARLPRGVGSDHDSYLSANVPGFFWEQFGSANYSYVHHTQHDWIPQVVQAYQRGTARVVASAAWRLSNMNQAVPRDDMGQRQQRQQRDPNAKRVGVYLGEGMLINDLVSNGLAAKAGMAKGDVIISVDGKKITNQGELGRTLKGLKKDSAKIVWKRGDKLMAATFDWKAKTAVTTEP